jgi:hypothetical protein
MEGDPNQAANALFINVEIVEQNAPMAEKYGALR